MKTKEKIIAVAYVFVSSVTVLVMLTAWFEQFQEKYLPSFLAAQKFALPVVISALAVAYLFFFEPERLAQKKTLAVMRIALAITLLLFSYFLTTVNMKITSEITMGLYIMQWGMIVAMTVWFGRRK